MSQILICKRCGPFGFDVYSFNRYLIWGYWPEFEKNEEIDAANMHMLYWPYYSRAVPVEVDGPQKGYRPEYCGVCIVNKLNEHVRNHYAVFCAPLWWRFCFEVKYNWSCYLPTQFQMKRWIKALWKSVLEE